MQKSHHSLSAGRSASFFLLPALLTLSIASTVAGQSFPSGSTGADGALDITAAGVTTTLPAPKGGGNIYNFTTITITQGSTLKLTGTVFPGPTYFLATGVVTVAGTIDLSGQSGSVRATTSAQRTMGPTMPGAGGYGGGEGYFPPFPQLPGLGPLGGKVQGGCDLSGGGGGFNGSQFLLPLVGGSGGAGSFGSGGAGGGALLIASSVSITVTGTITANGGSGADSSGGGAGGGIRLVAPTIAGNGSITAAGGGGGFGCNPGASGIVRLESFQYNFTGTTGGTVYTATPVNLFLPAANAQPSIMVTSIGGVTVKPNPTGTFTVPDVALNSSAPLTVNIKASNVPLGTIPTVYFLTENFPNQAIVATALAGTLASSTATATVTLNPGYSIGYVTANWTQ